MRTSSVLCLTVAAALFATATTAGAIVRTITAEIRSSLHYRGVIVLQAFGEGRIRFRNIKIKEMMKIDRLGRARFIMVVPVV